MTVVELALLSSKKQLMEIFLYEDQGPLKEYIGCKIECDMMRRFMKITQPVLDQSFQMSFLSTRTIGLQECQDRSCRKAKMILI
jgi:hypothetical protein